MPCDMSVASPIVKLCGINLMSFWDTAIMLPWTRVTPIKSEIQLEQEWEFTFSAIFKMIWPKFRHMCLTVMRNWLSLSSKPRDIIILWIILCVLLPPHSISHDLFTIGFNGKTVGVQIIVAPTVYIIYRSNNNLSSQQEKVFGIIQQLNRWCGD